ncbi:MAG TPA: PTS sugar transporter subunit IIA [Polyangiaceae bacterium]|nr:PTS sugar transporter subunit IIA [Polyangiaceae bacterium]
MRLTDILPADRILVDADGAVVQDKQAALRLLAHLLAPAVGAERAVVEEVLAERERLQSTGIGDGVAIPHASMEAAPRQAAALLLCPGGVPFDALDGEAVTIIFGVVGPRGATGEHLRTLARISRLLRDARTRARLVHADSAQKAHQLIHLQESDLR